MYEVLIAHLRECAKLDASNNTYTEAADAIEELSKMENTTRWIPVTERLPKGADRSGDICENVWLFFDDGNVYPGWMNGITEKVYYLNVRDDYIIKAPISRVKMWQPKPDPPKEEGA